MYVLAKGRSLNTVTLWPRQYTEVTEVVDCHEEMMDMSNHLSDMRAELAAAGLANGPVSRLSQLPTGWAEVCRRLLRRNDDRL